MKFWRLSLILLLVAAFPALAEACACSSAAPGQCQGLQSTDVVFVGTVTDAQLVPPEVPDQPAANSAAPSTSDPAGATVPQAAAPAAPLEAPIWRYHFRVDERFAGPDQPEMDIFAGGDDGDCGYKFQKGKQYVVFTHEGTDTHLYATICDGTRPVTEAAALIPQLRAMRDHRRVASVFGVLRRADPPFLAPPNDADDPIPVTSLKLRSKLDRFQANSDQRGVYSFYDVHAGTYNFTANLPSGTELTQRAQAAPLSAFEIPDDACYEYDVYALPTGHISGSVLGPDGKPLPVASLELYRVGSYKDSRPGYWGFQGATGEFEFDHVGPGRYVMVYNRANRHDPNSPFERTFYPGVASINEAKPIVLKDGQYLNKLKFKVTKGYPSRVLRVHVKFTGPRPAGVVTVSAKADKYENPSANKVADDLFTVRLFTDVNYTVSAWEDLAPQRTARDGKDACAMPSRIQAESVIVGGADSATKEITLTFPKPDCASQ